MGKRGAGEGSIYQDGDRWIAAVSVRDPATGKRRRLRRSARTQLGARQKLKQLHAIADSEYQGGEQLFRDFAERWFTHASETRWGPKQQQRVRAVLDLHLLPALGALAVNGITPLHVQALIDQKRTEVSPHRGRPLSARTLQIIRVTPGTALKQAMRWRMVSENVAALVETPKVETAERQVLSAAQARKLLERTAGTPLNLVYDLTLATGLRSQDVLGLSWDRVDLERGELDTSLGLHRVDRRWELRRPKSAKSARIVAIPKRLVKRLQQHRVEQLEARLAAEQWNDLDLLFVRPNGQPIHASSVVRRLARDLRAACLPVITFHDLRHSAATLMVERGVPLKAIQETLGHTSFAFTMDRYAHHSDALRAEVATRMEGVFEGEV